MPNLVLGVIDVPYSDDGTKPARKAPKRPKGGKAGKGGRAAKPKPPAADRGPTTTVHVAQALEEKYGVMRVFYEHNQDAITGALVHSLEGALEDLYAGSPIGIDPYAEASQEIASGFRQWLLQGEVEELGIAGVPTQAALDRRSLRFKSKVSNSDRPSFIDTGNYELAMRSWVE